MNIWYEEIAAFEMNNPLDRQHGVSTVLIGAFLVVLSTAPVRAQTFEEAACYVFAGNEICKTVTVVDQTDCIIKVHPRPVPNLDPALAGCLIDDVQTKKFFLKNARLEDMVVSNHVRAAGMTDLKSTVRIAGHEILQVLTEYDQNGAPVWEPRDTDTFEHEGDTARTRMALEHLSLNFCGPSAAVAVRTPSPDNSVAGNNATRNIIGVNEAFRLSTQGDIVLIDVRQESEWRKTGIAATAIPITMHQSREGFVKQIGEATGRDSQTPIALICAHGVRSSYLQRALKGYQLPPIIDVHEGMLGGPRNRGWIKSGLPIKPYDP